MISYTTRLFSASLRISLLLLPVSISVAQINFGSVPLTQFKDSTQTLTNTLGFSITVTQSYMKGNPSDFSIIAGGAPFTIPPLGTHTIGLRFTPSQLGLRVDTLVLVGTFPGSPMQAVLSGTGVPLPVELSSFTATRIPSGIALRWETETETNNYGFFIQRMLSIGENFHNLIREYETIGFLSGANNSEHRRTYTFVDSLRDSEFSDDQVFVATYRLKQVDFDGTWKYFESHEVSLFTRASESSHALINAFPNPFQTNTQVRKVNDDIHSLKLYDVLGRAIADMSDDAIRHRIITLPRNLFHVPGMYLLRARSANRSQTLPLFFRP